MIRHASARARVCAVCRHQASTRAEKFHRVDADPLPLAERRIFIGNVFFKGFRVLVETEPWPIGELSVGLGPLHMTLFLLWLHCSFCSLRAAHDQGCGGRTPGQKLSGLGAPPSLCRVLSSGAKLGALEKTPRASWKDGYLFVCIRFGSSAQTVRGVSKSAQCRVFDGEAMVAST